MEDIMIYHEEYKNKEKQESNFVAENYAGCYRVKEIRKLEKDLLNLEKEEKNIRVFNRIPLSVRYKVAYPGIDLDVNLLVLPQNGGERTYRPLFQEEIPENIRRFIKRNHK